MASNNKKTQYSAFSESLYKQAVKWAGGWTRLAHKYLISSPDLTIPGAAPKSLAGLIRVQSHVERKSAQRFIIRATATDHVKPPREVGLPGSVAHAYEFGSGIHAEYDFADFYPIVPKTKPMLVFFWQRFQATASFGKVAHPGVEAASGGKGYLRPSRDELLEKGDEELRSNVKKAILDDLRLAFKSGRPK